MDAGVISYLKDQSLYFEKLSEDKYFLFQEINNLAQDQINYLIDFYKNRLGSLNIIRLAILKILRSGDQITEDKIQEIKDKFKSKDTHYFEQYFGENILNFIKNYRTPNGGDPFQSWPSLFRCLYSFRYYGEIKENVNACFTDMANYVVSELSLSNYTFDITGFDGPQNQGQINAFVAIFPQELKKYNNAVNYSLEFDKGKFFAGVNISRNNKINIEVPAEFKFKEYSTIEEVINVLKNANDFVSDNNTKLIEKYKKMQNYLLDDLYKFIENSIKIKNNDLNNATRIPIVGTYRSHSYKARFGAGKFSRAPWFAFLSHGQEIQRGIYPVILYNTEFNINNFEICYGISETNVPGTQWLSKFLNNLPHSSCKKYPASYVKNAYTINNIEDLKNNTDSIMHDIDEILDNYSENFEHITLGNISNIENNFSEALKNLFWYQAIGLSMYLNGKDKTYKVRDIKSQPLVSAYANQKDSQNVYTTVILQLQSHTNPDSKTVNYSQKIQPELFDKDENAEWYLTEKGKEYIELNLSDYLEALKNHNFYKAKRQGIHYWMLSAGEHAYMWEDFQKNSIIAVGWDEWNLGSIENYQTKNDLQQKMIEYNPESSNMNNALCLWQFANEMQVDDIVYIKNTQTKISGRGVVESDYIYDEARDRYKHVRKVKWTHIGEWETGSKWAIKTLTDITPYTEDVEKLENLFNVDIKEENEDFDLYSEEDFLNDVFMNKRQYNILKNLLLNKKNIILQGAPGVGKTYTAKRLCYSILGRRDTSRVEMIQFHQSYGYEDFIMGYRPSSNSFELKEGPFYKFCKRAEEDSDNKYFFIIDEINRGKLSKIFGELLMLIEPDKRGQTLRLLYKDEQFSVPKNVYIIGMMNTADRSIAMIDYALRRRFAFYEFTPAFETDSFRIYKSKFNNHRYNALIDEIIRLNQVISEDSSLGTGFQIGHSYFCNTKAIDDEWLNSVVDYEIIPLLKEYWFDEENKVKEWTSRLKNAIR